MLEQVRKEPGEVFHTVSAYTDDVDQYWSRIDRFDKLERLQQFHQPESRSWQACIAGHWEESLRQTERDRPDVVAEFAEDARLGYTSYRVRVVEFPITAYLQWEMHRFKVRVECGENIRVIGPEAVAQYELDGVVPELIFMGSHAMYEVLYDATGVLAGGRKSTDPELIAACRAEVQALYTQGEDFETFFEREIVPLPPPHIEPRLSPSAGS